MLIYLKPLSIFPELHSDTIFGSIVYAINELYPEIVDEMINDFKKEPPFLISSTFPFAYNENEKIRFYPKIICKNKENVDLPVENRKKYKKIKFLEEELFFDLLEGNLSEEDIILNLSKYNKINNLLMINDYDFDFGFSENVIPNNSINRLNGETNIFYTVGNEFKNLGLYFFVEFNNEKYKHYVKSAIRFLRDRGFGKDISVGKGHFDYEIEDNFSLLDSYLNVNNNDYFVTLSRFIPNKKDFCNLNRFYKSNYELSTKRGRSPKGDIRKKVRFFKEGSIFYIQNSNKFYGKIVESGIENPAIEYGFAFPIKFINK